MSGYESLLNLVNADNPIQQPLSLADVVFSDPIEDIGATWNTKVTISAVPGSRYTGTVDVCYNRVPLDALNNSVINNIISDVPFTPEIILNLLNSSRDTTFTLSDMRGCDCKPGCKCNCESINIPNIELGDVASINLTIKSNSLEWIADTNVSVLYGLPSNIGLLHHLLNHVFPNNEYFATS
jgi:hypothetical protein